MRFQTFRKHTLALVLAAIPMAATAGEYDRVHVGPMLHLGWSPNQDYAQAGGSAVAPDVAGQQQFAVIPGIELRLTPIPAKFSLAFDFEYLRPITKGAGIKDTPVTQQGVRGTMRLIYSPHGSMNPGLYWWAGPAAIDAKTTTQNFDVIPAALRPPQKETIKGFGGGFGTRSESESFTTLLEANVYQMQTSKAGSKFGGLTLELGFGIQF
jgi:hypothetical protein